METINYIGKYDSLELLWKAYPGGGIEGDYALIGDSYYGWDKYKSQWVETVLSEQTIIVTEPSVETKDAVNFLGVFDSWADVWKSFPEGGHPGDYLTIDVTNYLWDASLLNWTTLSKDANVIEGETPAGSSPVELNYLGNFASMADVWYFFPEGGHLGDFVQVASVFYVWDTSSLNWKDSANTTYVNYDFSGKALEASQTRTTINYLGSFAELNDVWIVYPEGGHEGDYIHLSEEIQVWNKYRSNWGDYETPQTPAVKTDEIDGSLKITHDLIVGGTAYLSSIVTDLSKLGLHELSLYVNSALIGTYNPALGNSVFNIDGIATQEKLDDEVEKINLRIDETELSLRALISSISGSSHSHANLPVLNKITDEKLLNWDTAFSWGNHADAGYLKKVSTEQIIEALPDMYIGRSPIQYEEKAQDLTGISSLMLEGGEEILKYNSVYGAWELTGDLIVSGTLSIGAAASGGSGAEYTQWDWASIIKLSEDPGLGNLASAWALKQEYDDRKKDINTLTNSISGINSMIPATASQSNKLADIDFVNSSIANNAATFRGTFETISALPTSNVKPNDYAFVISENSEGNPEYQRYKYNGSSWVFEYTLNNSSFTAEQWAAITSGISAKKIENYDAHLTNKSNPHQVTASQVGLDQVENIKLSTWTGSTKITTLGTITTGVWNGTKIANAYLTNPKITIGSTIVNLGDTATAFDGLTSLKFAGANGALTYNSTDKYYNLADSLVVNGILAVGESGTGTSSGYTQLEWSDIQRLSKTEAGNLASAYAVKEVYNELNAAINTLASSATKVSFAPNLTGGKVIGTLTIDGTGTILYAPQNYAWGDITGKPTTIAGYGITDVKIANGIITIGSNTITPLTSHQKVSLASGTNNGTLKLTVGNTTTDNIAVKGLGSAAYTNSDAYAAASHTHSQYLTAHQTIYTLTIQKNGTQVDTYTPNSANKTINISDVASATTLSNHTGDKVSHITAAERTAWNTVAGLFGVDENGDIYVKNDKGFYTGGFLSAGSPGSGSSGGGYTQYEWDTIKEMTSKPAENGILASAWSVKQAYDELNKKATAVSFKQTIASGVEIGTITIDNTSTKIYSPSLAALMGASAIGGESAYPYWNGSAWATKSLGSNAFTSISKVSQLTNDSGYITGITKAMVETVLTGNITTHTHSYLPLSGGSMSNTNLVTNLNADLLDGYNASSFAKVASHNNLIASGNEFTFVPSAYAGEVFINYRTTGGTDGAITKYNFYNGAGGLLASISQGQFSGNAATATKATQDGNGKVIADTYLPLSGGMIHGTQTSPFNINTSATKEVGLRLYMSDSPKLWVGYTPDVGAYLYAYSNHKLGLSDAGVGFLDSNTLIHSGNYNSYSPKLDGTGASGTWGINISGNAATATNADKLDNIDSTGFLQNYSLNYGDTISNAVDISPTLTAGVAKVHILGVEYSSVLTGYDFKNKAWQLRFRPSYNDGIYFRSQGTGTSWKAIAFTDSDITGNASSATKLQNSRTLWGQSFDGTGNVSGNMTGVGSITPTTDSSHDIGTSSNQFRWVYAQGLFSKVGRVLSLGAGDTDHMRIITNGNVGIGTKSPSYKLHIVGTAYATENIIAAGDITAGSDIRYKDKIQDLRLSVHDIALAPAFTYKWNNREDALVHIGSSAQYWLNTNAKDAVYYDKQNDFYHLNYASLALCNTIILARGMETQEEKIARLEDRIKELEERVKQFEQ